MNSFALIALALLLAPQSGVAIGDEAGPPQENLLRAREAISSVLCRRVDRETREHELDRRYAERLEAVHDQVAATFGAAVADRGYFSVGSCRIFRSNQAFNGAYRAAVVEFERILEDYEGRYGISSSAIRRQ